MYSGQAPMIVDTPISIEGSTPSSGTRMYKVSNSKHEQYGKVVIIERVEEGGIETPFFAVQAALKSRRLWKEEGIKNIRFLVHDQVMTPSQLESWSREEYQSLPKCADCAKILSGEVHTHQLSIGSLFCSQACADQNYYEKVERLKDEEEIGYL